MSKYKFNKDQLRFVEDKLGIRGKVRVILTYVLVSILLAILYYIIFAFFFNTREEESLLKEKQLMEKQYVGISKKMDMLDKVIGELEVRDKEIYMNIFKSTPPDLMSDNSNDELYKQLDSSGDISLVRFSVKKVADLEKQTKTGGDKLNSIYNELKGAENSTDIPSIMPIRGMSLNQTGAIVGNKIHPFYKTTAKHTGIDLLAGIGTEVRATANGVVVDVLKSDRGRGNQVIVEHWGNYRTVYAHLGDVLVRKSQPVKQGSILGRVGNSGLSFAPHLHYEVVLNGKPVEPVNYFFAELTPREYKEMLIIAMNTGQSLD